MADRLETLRVVDPVLTRLLWGYLPPAWTGAVLFPIVPVEKEAGKIPKFGAEAFQIYNCKRPIRGTRARIDYEAASIPYLCEEYSLEVAVDEREVEEAIFDARRRAAFTSENAIAMQVEYLQATQACNPDNYAVGNKTELTGTDQWSDLDDSDPIDDVGAAIDAIQGTIGQIPNVLVMGPAVMKSLKNHPAIIERIKYSERAIVTEDLLAAIFGIQTVKVAAAAYSSEAGTFTSVWGKNVIIAFVPPAAARDTGAPAYAYTLRKTGRPVVKRYVDQRANSEIVYAEDLLDAKILSDVAGYLIENAVA